MADSVGPGLLLNIVFWTVAVLVAVGLAFLAVNEFFPGREQKAPKESRGGRSGAPAAPSRADSDDTGESYRQAS